MFLRGKRVLLIGDSQVQGIAPRFRNILESIGGSVVVSDHPGMSLSQAISLDLRSLVANADAVLVSFGGNGPPRSVDNARVQLGEFVRKLGGKRAFWLTVLPSTDPEIASARERMAGWQRELLPEMGVTPLDGESLASDLSRRDTVHLTANSYSVLADRIFDRMQRDESSAFSALSILPVVVGVVVGAVLAFLPPLLPRRRPR